MQMVVVILIVLGLVLGSFVNAFVWRLHEQEELKEKKPAKLQQKLRELSILQGRSMCPSCRHTLAAKDLVPVASWLMLRGKCRYCHRPISWQYPAVEAGVAVMFALSYLYWPFAFTGYGLLAFCVWLVVLVGFAVLTVYDIRWFLLPDKIVWPLVVLVGAQVAARLLFFDGDVHTIIDTALGISIASGLFYILYTLSKGEWIGGGDVKLGIIIGLLVGGPVSAMTVLFLASLLGTLISVPFLLNRKMKRTSLIPFGPFLMTATVFVYLANTSFADWLTRLLIG